MPEQDPTQPTTMSWGARVRHALVQRAALTAIGAVTFAAVAPALANAAGADVPNPVVYALRSSGSALADTLSGETDCTPETVDPTVEASASVEPEVSVEPSVEASVEASVEPSASVEPAESVAPSVEPSTDPSAEVSIDASPVADSECDEDTVTVASASPSESEDADDADDGTHGRIVSTVAHCAPKGKDPLFEVTGDDLARHGSFVKAAAHGDSLTTPFGTFDLSTQAGADDLCAALEAARAAQASLSPAPDDDERGQKGKKDREPKKAKKAKPHSESDDDADDSEESDEDAG